MLPANRNRYTKFGVSPPGGESKPIDRNALGLLIVLNKTGRRGPSMGLNNADDDNEISAFSYCSDSEDDSETLNDECRAYFSALNDEFALAMALDDKYRVQFEPCRKLKVTGKKNVYKKSDSPRKISPPIGDHARFWPPSSSWSAIGRLFGKFKRGQQHSNGNVLRRHSLQAPAVAKEDDAEEEKNWWRKKYYDDPITFLQRLQDNFGKVERKNSGDVSHLKVVSRCSDDSNFTVSFDGAERLAVCKEYFSRLTCYDAMPQLTELVAIHVTTPVEDVFNILHGHRELAAVLWHPPVSTAKTAMQGLCDILHLVRLLWPLFIDSSASKNVREYLKRPVSEFCSIPVAENEENNESAYENGLSAECSLMEGARFFYRGRRDAPTMSVENTEYRQHFGRWLLPLVNDTTGDVVHILTANQIARLLTKELCKFELTSAFDRINISHLHHFAIRDWTAPMEEDKDRWRLYDSQTLKEASCVLMASQMAVLPVFAGSTSSKLTYRTTFSLIDVVDMAIKCGYCGDAVLAMTLDELLSQRDMVDIPKYSLSTPLSTVLKNVASSSSNRGNWDSILPIGAVLDDNGEFVGFVESEDLLDLVLSSDCHQIDLSMNSNQSSRTVSFGADGHDSGVGDDDVMFLDDTLTEL